MLRSSEDDTNNTKKAMAKSVNDLKKYELTKMCKIYFLRYVKRLKFD